MSEEMLSSIRQTFKQLIADAMTFRGPQEPDMVLSHGKSTTYMIAFKMMKYFMQASYNITGRKNGANIWITLEQSIFRTEPLRNNWNDTLRCIIFGTIRNKWK